MDLSIEVRQNETRLTEGVRHISNRLPGEHLELVKGPNIVSLPDFSSLPDELTGPVILKFDDDISTDTIMPAGYRVLPYRSNVPEISKFVLVKFGSGLAELSRYIIGDYLYRR